MKKLLQRIGILIRPWIWMGWILYKYTRPVPVGLWILNMIVQRIFCINKEFPFMVHFTSRVSGNITIGKNVFRSFAISGNCYIQGMNGIYFDDDASFAPGVKIISANHSYVDFNKFEKTNPIYIGKRVWIGANAVILPGVNIGDDAVVAAGSIISNDVKPGTIVGGNPARLLGNKPGFKDSI